jgi:ATP-dependent Clp protease ATP-binding subunit ClpC
VATPTKPSRPRVHSSRYIPDRYLPDKAIDLIDEAGARVKLRQTTLPADLADIQKRIKFIVHRMENAIANHEFEKARFYSDEERKERENMRQLREKYNLDDSSTGCVTKDDIEDVVARWTGVPMTSIKEEEIAKLLRIEEELHKRVISQEKAISALARAIRRSRAGLKAQQSPGRQRSCSWAPRAWARPKWRARWPGSCSAARRAWSASTCPSTWRSTRFRS